MHTVLPERPVHALSRTRRHGEDPDDANQHLVLVMLAVDVATVELTVGLTTMVTRCSW
jgi:hypothetical protein